MTKEDVTMRPDSGRGDTPDRYATNRRTLLRLGGGVGSVATLAGCLSRLGFTTRSARAPPLVEDRPEAVYIPSHIEGMKMAGMADAGPYKCALTFSFPHRFWLVTGQNRKKVTITSDDSAHLMVSLWDPETGVVPPTSNVTLEITRDGETVVTKPPWPMLSQNMGFHFGDNVALPGGGTYTVTVDIGAIRTRRTGAFQGRFGESATATFSFEFSQKRLEEIMFRRLEEKQGQRGAVEPMGMKETPLAQLPPADRLPGRNIGEATSGDGKFVIMALDQPPAGIDGSGSYLAVSARTPYNRYPLPFMGLSATVIGNGESLFDGPLQPTLDPELNHHYGAVVEELPSGGGLELTVGAPPQVARHEGYETAFFEMPPMRVTL